VAAAVFLAYQMYYSQTPARHADHDHAIAKIDAGGFLWVKAPDGERRNLVGRPEKVLVLHWFDPTSADSSEETAAAEFAASVADDPMVEIIFVADSPSWEGIDAWAEAAGVPMDRIYLDEKGKTGGLFGVRRLPETLIYDPLGLLAHQARGPMDWTSPRFRSEIERATHPASRCALRRDKPGGRPLPRPPSGCCHLICPNDAPCRPLREPPIQNFIQFHPKI